jgi:epoxide hydrolase-like predicted phosphatase
MTIRALLFDLGGVLLRTEDLRPRTAWERRLGLQPGALERAVFGNPVSMQSSLGRAESEAVWAEAALQLGLSPQDGDRLREDFFAGDRLDQTLMTFIRSQRPLRKTGLITNIWKDGRRWLQERWHALDAFDVIIASAEVGLMKPDPGIYQLALERLGIPASEAVFVDDMPANVDAARAVGMHALRFQHTAQTLSELHQLLGEPEAGILS